VIKDQLQNDDDHAAHGFKHEGYPACGAGEGVGV
jgi:hypothetical protein